MSTLYQLKIDPEHARELSIRGASLILLDVPEGTPVGIDHHTFLVGPKFKGVKMVPPGVHAISYTSAGHGSYGPTTAFFVNVRGGEVAGWRWDPAEEVLRKIGEDEIQGIENAVKSFQLDQNLAPYDLTSYPQWRELAGKISCRVLDSVAPIGGNINVFAETLPSGTRENSLAAPQTPAEEALDEILRKSREERGLEGVGEAVLAAEHAGRCFFTELPRLVKRAGLSPTELTAVNLDKSAVLEEVLTHKFDGKEDDFLGEFQFAFLAFLLGHSLQSFDQWKDFVRLIFGCEDAVMGPRFKLFAQFLRIFNAQLAHSLAPVGFAPVRAAVIRIPSCLSSPWNRGELFQTLNSHYYLLFSLQGCSPTSLGVPIVDDLLKDSFLRQLSTSWLRWVTTEAGASVPVEVSEAAQRVAQLLERTLGWECSSVMELYARHSDDDDDDEDRPVVVENVEIADDDVDEDRPVVVENVEVAGDDDDDRPVVVENVEIADVAGVV